MALQLVAQKLSTLVLLPLVCVAGQALDQHVTIRVATQLVEISAVVTDRSGNPVADLAPPDFEIYDRGKKQEIKVFQLEDHRRTHGNQPRTQTLPGPAPGVVSNRLPAGPDSRNAATVIVIDVGNSWSEGEMAWQDLVYARDQLAQFLRQLHPEDQLGIYLMGRRRFWILHEYNQPCADIVERLATWKTPTEAPGAAKASDVWTEFAIHFAHIDEQTAKEIHKDEFWYRLEDIFPRAIHIPPEQDESMNALVAAAQHLGAVAGRKNIILISSKLALPPASFQSEVAALHSVIGEAVAVYTIDPGGVAPYTLDASFVIPSSVTAFGGGAPRVHQYIADAEQIKRQRIIRLQTTLRALAEDTGGKAFLNNDVAGAIQGAFDDSRVTYTLGFYSDAPRDGSFHPIRVKVRRERTNVRCRAGYFAPRPPQEDQASRESRLRRAVWSPLDASGIELSATLAPGNGPGAYDLKLTLGLSNIDLQPVGDRWSGRIEVKVFSRDNSDTAHEALSEVWGLNLRQENFEKMLKSGLEYSRTVILDPKTDSVRMIVQDLNGDGLGTLTIRIPKAEH